MKLWIPLMVWVMLSLALVAQQPESSEAEQPAPAYKPEKPQQVIDRRLADLLPADQIKWLGEEDARFLARSRTAETGTPLGNILIVSAPGKSIDSPGYIRHAIDYFPSISWHTMIISAGDLLFPVPIVKQPASANAESQTSAADSANPESQSEPQIVPEQEWYQEQRKDHLSRITERVKLAEKVLSEPQKGYVLITSSVSASLIVSAIRDQQINPKALVIIDIDYPVSRYREQLVADLKTLSLPVYDVYQPLNKELADKRRILSHADNYQQRLIPAVDEDYLGVEGLLLRSIRGWLKSTVLKQTAAQ